MSEDDSAQPDPIANVDEMDIDALLERTRELAAKASEEVGPPGEEAPPDASCHDAEPATAEEVSQVETPAPEESASEPPAPSASDDDAGNVDAEADMTAQLAELESMLSQAGKKVDEPADDLPGHEAPASEATPPAEGDAQRFEDFDDFDITVDLSDDDDEAVGKEIESKASAVGKGDAGAPRVAAQTALPLLTGILDGGLRAVGHVFVVLDSPFAKMSPEAKQVMAYIAIATFLVSVGGLIYSSVHY